MIGGDVALAHLAVEEALRARARRHANLPPSGSAVDGHGHHPANGRVRPGDGADLDERALAVAALDAWIETTAHQRLLSGEPAFTPAELSEIRHTVLTRVFDLGELQPLLDDDEIETIHINGADRVFVRDADGSIRPVGALADGDDEQLVGFVLRLAANDGLSERRWDTGAPALNLTLREGSRLHGLLAITRRPSLTIRRHRLLDEDLDGLVGRGTLPRALAQLLAAAIRARQSVVIAGGPSAGKSTTLRALSSAIAPARRIVTIEDTLELHLDLDVARHPNCVAIETRPPNTERRGEITVEWALREALRMDPDVLIVGEVRIDETVPMLIALAAGNVSGSLSTVHAYSSAHALEQLQTYAMVSSHRMPAESSARLIGSAVDWVVHVERRPDARRRNHRVVTSVREVCGSQGIHVRSNEVFRRHRDGGIEAFASVSEETRQRLLDVEYDVADFEDAARFGR